MPKKRFSNKRIALALRQAVAGTAVGEICRRMGVAEATFYRGKKGLREDGRIGDPPAEVARRGEHEAEAAGGGSDARQDHAAGCPAKKVAKPVRRREIVRHYQDVVALSERRACRAMGFGRASHRYQSRRNPAVEPRMRLKELAESRLRYGYRRLHILQQREAGG